MSSSDSLRRNAITVAAASVAITLLGGSRANAAFDVVEKTIPQLEAAYADGDATVNSVVNQYISRIYTYSTGPNGVNAVAQINPDLNSEITQVQQLIASGATTSQYPLLGVPILVKNSYDVQGMVTTNGVSVLNGSGTPGSTTLIAPTDAPNIASLKAAGAIILGKTNMSTMAYSFDGIDNAGGVVRNPYNFNRQPGGSSSGSGAAEASNFAMLTMGGETGGSIRVPTTYNDLVGLKTSAGLISPNGTWPLTPSRDVVGPIAKSVTDVAYAMNALVQTGTPNIWNGTPYYPVGGPIPGSIGTGLGEGSDGPNKGLTTVTGTRPVDYTSFLTANALKGKVLAVPNSAIGIGTQYDGTVNPLIAAQFQKAIKVLQSEGATIKYVDVPAESLYYSTIGKTSGATTTGFNDQNGNPIPYPTTTVGGTTPSSTWSNNAAAYYYEKQIESYHDPVIKNLNDFAAALNAGRNGASGSSFSTLNSAYTNIAALAAIYNAGAAKGFADADGDGQPDNPDAIKALAAFTTLREQDVDDWMKTQGIDAIVAPTMGSVAPLVASALRSPGTPNTDPYGGGSASLIDRFEGNILGMPALNVPMGAVGDGSLFTGIQFEGQLDSEAKLLGYGYAFEQATKYRVAPDLTQFVPEPASLAMLALGGIGLLRRRREPALA